MKAEEGIIKVRVGAASDGRGRNRIKKRQGTLGRYLCSNSLPSVSTHVCYLYDYLLNCTFMVFALFHIYAIFHSKKEKKCFLNIFSAGRPWRISCQVRKSACDTRQGPGLGESLNGHSTCPPLLPPTGTHRVVSWLMLVKEELLKELILLLLRSLKKTKSPNRRFHSKKRPGI